MLFVQTHLTKSVKLNNYKTLVFTFHEALVISFNWQTQTEKCRIANVQMLAFHYFIPFRKLQKLTPTLLKPPSGIFNYPARPTYCRSRTVVKNHSSAMKIVDHVDCTD